MNSPDPENPDSLLNPAQAEVLSRLRVPRESRPRFRSTLRMEIRTRLEQELVTTADELDEPLWVSKRSLAAVHGCEAHYLADRKIPFTYSIPVARGSVAHKAIELSVHIGSPRSPAVLVTEAIEILSEGQNALADFLHHLDEAERAELVGESIAMVSGFLDTFPPLRRGWRPTTEPSKRAELCSNKITLGGRFDLTLGAPDDTTAGRVIIDMKTGGFSPEHREDMRFYALIETLVTGVPPLMIATHYLESGRLHEEMVDENVLDAAVRRTVDGVRRLALLDRHPTEAVRKPGPPCRWCPISEDCEPGSAWLTDHNDW